MKIMVDVKGNKGPPAAEGTHVAILQAIVVLGMQESRFGDEPRREVFLSFQVTDEFNEWSEPKRVMATVTASLTPKAKLREYAEAILGARLNESAGKFDILELLGKACLLNVQHKESNGNTYANIKSLAPLPRSMEAPTLRGELLSYTPDEHDEATWEKLPKFLQEKIAKRIVEEKKPAPARVEEELNDDIPF